MNTRLQNGDRFPDLSISTVGDGPPPGLGLLLSTVAFHESLNLSLTLGILLIGGGIWIVTNAAVTPPRRPA